jgi:phytoene synthase
MSEDLIYTYAEKILSKYGTSYRLATRFFPKDLQYATAILYAFVRIPDEYIDNPENGKDPLEMLTKWKGAWQETIDSGRSDDELFSATYMLHKKYDIPFEYSIRFIDTMIQDVTVTRYESYADLESYMYGSASVIGFMMAHIIGFKDKGALPYAQKLGEAMQLTNFIRDIKEDYDERSRIYIPQEDLKKFSAEPNSIPLHKLTPELKKCLEYQVERAERLYREASPGINMLNKRGRLAVVVAMELYRSILTEIRKGEYDIFIRRHRTSKIKKIWCIIKILWNKKQWGL